jgi:asparagine synthase (glutamine-hydrolysing)
MCGIGGYIGKSLGSLEIPKDAMIESLRHRGPDGHGSFENEYGFIVHTRLSIIDTSNNGLQPFTIRNNSIAAVHNGEIYNHDLLRKSLGSEIEYKSTSDSEVVPYYYLEKGIKTLAADMEGMFAIALLDSDLRKLYLVRDTFGIKPLYYAKIDNNFVFGSEIKAILSICPDFKNNISQQAMFDFVSLGYIVEPETFYQQIYCVPTGSILTFDIDSGQISIDSYRIQPKTEKVNVNINQLDDLLTQVIKEQSVADVPMASFLSGGVDSTLVTAYYSKIARNPKTFSVAFQSEERDESSIALETAKALRTQHHTIKPIIELNTQELDQLIKHFDQPFGDLSILSTNILCKEVNKEVKVALSGDGGDEFVAGYTKFKHLWILNNTPKLFKKIFKLIAKIIPFKRNRIIRLISLLDLTYDEQVFELSSYLRNEDLVKFFNNSFESPKRHFKQNSNYSIIQNTTLNQLNTSLSSKMLTKVDRISMLNMLEVRVPLLDQRLTSVLFSMKDSEKIDFTKTKIKYRELIAKHLPSYRQTKKVGFDFDYRELENLGLVNFWISYLKNLTKDSTLWKTLSYDFVLNWVEEYQNRSNTKYSLQSQMQVIFNIYVLAKWFEWNNA